MQCWLQMDMLGFQRVIWHWQVPPPAQTQGAKRRLEDSTGGPGTIAEPRSPRRGAAVLSSGGIGARRKGRPALRPRGDPEERRGDESWITLYQIYEGANFASRLGFKGQSVGSPGNY